MRLSGLPARAHPRPLRQPRAHGGEMTTRSRFRRILTAAICATLCAIGLMATAPPPPAETVGGQPAAPANHGTVPIYLNTNYSPAERAADLVSRMTLAEK